jgi:hypothetical protein
VRSVEATAIALAAATALLAAGCDTTQQKSARAKVQAQRVLASRERVLVTRSSSQVKVERATALQGRSRSAVVVLLRNVGARPVSDLPISVRVGGRYLNRRRGLPYFQTHAPAIAPGGEAVWVFITRARVREGRAFARVGATPSVDSGAARLPSIRASLGLRDAATVTNSSGLPQYGLPVYAYAERSGHVVAAGRGTVPSLGAGKSTSVRLTLVGSAGGTPLRLAAAPTIFK